MSRTFATLLIAVGWFSTVCSPGFAHHGVSGYDSEHPIVLRGTVTAFAWQNPHVQIDLDVKNDKGDVEHWTCIAASPNGMSKFGWTRDSVKAGDQVAVGLQPAKNGERTGAFIKVVLANGEMVGNSKQQPDR
jgi:hypothetical protein